MPTNHYGPCIPAVNATTSEGYATRVIDGRKQYEHRAAWEAVNGPVPAGLVLDHTCHDPETCKGGPTCPHRSCINPDHLMPVTRGDNGRRGHHWQLDKTHCPANHPYDEENTYTDPRGRRQCRICRAARKTTAPRTG